MRGPDEAILLLVNGLRAPSLDPVARWLSEWGLYVCLAVLPLRALVTRTRKDAAQARDGALVYFLALFVAETLVKPLVARPRPTAVASLAAQLHVLGARPSAQSLSFPSGTATACVAVAVYVWLVAGPKLGAPVALFAALVSLSRLYVGVHWPSDLVAGALLGALVAWSVRRLDIWITRG
jgi:undecaprenyl-diphosphatase